MWPVCWTHEYPRPWSTHTILTLLGKTWRALGEPAITSIHLFLVNHELESPPFLQPKSNTVSLEDWPTKLSYMIWNKPGFNNKNTIKPPPYKGNLEPFIRHTTKKFTCPCLIIKTQTWEAKTIGPSSLPQIHQSCGNGVQWELPRKTQASELKRKNHKVHKKKFKFKKHTQVLTACDG